MEPDNVARVLGAIGIFLGLVGTCIAVLTFLRIVRRQRPNLAVETAHWIIAYGLERKADYLLFEVAATNRSDVGNTILEYGLVIGRPYNTSTRPIHFSETALGETILEPAPGSPFSPGRIALKNVRLDHLANPVNLPPHEARIGWVGFPLPSIQAENVQGVDYWLWVVTGEGRPVVLEVDLRTAEWTKMHGEVPPNVADAEK